MTTAILLGFLFKLTIFFSFIAGSLILVVDLIYPTWVRIRNATIEYLDQYLPVTDTIEIIKKAYYSKNIDDLEKETNNEAEGETEEPLAKTEGSNGQLKVAHDAKDPIANESAEMPEETEPETERQHRIPMVVLYYLGVACVACLIGCHPPCSQFLLIISATVCVYTLVVKQSVSDNSLKHACLLASCLITCFGVLYAPQITAVQLLILGFCVFLVERYTRSEQSAIPNWRRLVVLMIVYYFVWFMAKKWIWHFVLVSIVLFVLMDRFRWNNCYNITFWFIYVLFCASVVKMPIVALMTVVMVGLRAAAKIFAADQTIHSHFDSLAEFANWVFQLPDLSAVELLMIGKDTLMNSVKGSARGEEGDKSCDPGNEQHEEAERDEEGEASEVLFNGEAETAEGGEDEGEHVVDVMEEKEQDEDVFNVNNEHAEFESDHHEQYTTPVQENAPPSPVEIHTPVKTPSTRSRASLSSSARSQSNSSMKSQKSPPAVKDMNLSFQEDPDNSKIGEIEKELERKLDRIKMLEQEVEGRLHRITKLEKLNRVKMLESECEEKLERIIKIETALEKRVSRSNSVETQCELDKLDNDQDFVPRKRLVQKTSSINKTKSVEVPTPTAQPKEETTESAPVVVDVMMESDELSEMILSHEHTEYNESLDEKDAHNKGEFIESVIEAIDQANVQNTLINTECGNDIADDEEEEEAEVEHVKVVDNETS